MGKLILDTTFTTLNEYIKAERTNRYIAAKIKKNNTDKVYWLVKEQGFTLPDNVKYDITFIWYVNNKKTDPDNISFSKKFILDGLVKAGVLKKDSMMYVGNFADIFVYDRTLYHRKCVVYFEENVLEI